MEPNPLRQDPQAEAPQRSAMSLGGRLLNVFATPGDVFQEVQTANVATANWLVPAVLFILVSWVGAWLALSQDPIKHQLSELTDQAIQKQAEKAHMSEQQAEKVREAAAKWGTIGRAITAGLGPVLVAFASPFLWGLFLWLVSTKALKAEFAYMKAVEFAGLASMVSVLAAIVETLLQVGLGNYFAAPGLMLLVKDFDPSNTGHSLLAVVNVMTFWVLAVRAIGLARLSGASFAKAAGWVFGIWAAYTGFFIGLAAVSQAVLKRMHA